VVKIPERPAIIAVGARPFIPAFAVDEPSNLLFGKRGDVAEPPPTDRYAVICKVISPGSLPTFPRLSVLGRYNPVASHQILFLTVQCASTDATFDLLVDVK
jgi:hypothetical protein